MNWRNLFKISKTGILIRIILLVILFLLIYWGIHYLVPYTGTPIPEYAFLISSFEMLFNIYILFELGIFLIRLYLFLEFNPKKYIAIAYLVSFISLNIFGGFGNGKYDLYFFICGYIFLVLLMGLLLSCFEDKYK
jgi:hypothetical protein